MSATLVGYLSPSFAPLAYPSLTTVSTSFAVSSIRNFQKYSFTHHEISVPVSLSLHSKSNFFHESFPYLSNLFNSSKSICRPLKQLHPVSTCLAVSVRVCVFISLSRSLSLYLSLPLSGLSCSSHNVIARHPTHTTRRLWISWFHGLHWFSKQRLQ